MKHHGVRFDVRSNGLTVGYTCGKPLNYRTGFALTFENVSALPRRLSSIRAISYKHKHLSFDTYYEILQ